MLYIIGLIIILLLWVAIYTFSKKDAQIRGIVHGAATPIIGVGLVAVILWTLFFSITTVGTGQIAVMTRFGRVTGGELGEGIHVKLPIDKPNKYDVKVQKQEEKAAAASQDLQDVNSTLVLNYRLEPGRVDEIHRTLGTKYQDKIIAPALQEVFKGTTSKYNATELITERAAVKRDATEALRGRLKPYGINVVGVNLVNFSFSKEFASAIEDKQVAQQRAERARFNLEAARIDAEAQQVQALTLSDLYLKKLFLEKWDGKMPQVISGDGQQTIVDLMP